MGPSPTISKEGIVGRGFPVEVFNVLGAGDAFMSGFFRGWLRDKNLSTCATWANVCGAFACRAFFARPSTRPGWNCGVSSLTEARSGALRMDAALNHIHWATTRRRQIPLLMAFAIDHRIQLEELAGNNAAERIPAFKVLAVRAAQRVADGRPGFGMLLDDKYGRDALFAAGEDRFGWPSRSNCPVPARFNSSSVRILAAA